MLSDGQIWKNGTRIAQINMDNEAFKAVVFKTCEEKLVFSNIIDVEDTQILFDMGFKPTEHVLVAKDK